MSKERGGRIRGFYFEIDGADDTLQEGLRSFGAALGRALGAPLRPVNSLPSPTKRRQDGPSDQDEHELEAEDSLLEPLDSNSNGGTLTKRKPSSARKAPPMPKVIELDVEGNAGTSLSDFVVQKRPETINDKILVVAAWFKEHTDVAEITSDHLFTCFKLMDWTPHPASYNGALRDLKRKQHTMDKGTTPGAYRINIAGLNAVAKMGAQRG